MDMAAILVMWPGPFEQFLHPKEAPYEIWLSLAQRFLRRRCLKGVYDRQTTDRQTDRQTKEANLSYKLTNEPSAQES